MIPVKKEYLGDGVYVEDHGFQYRLFTREGSTETELFLEPDGVLKLAAFVEKCLAGVESL